MRIQSFILFLLSISESSSVDKNLQNYVVMTSSVEFDYLLNSGFELHHSNEVDNVTFFQSFSRFLINFDPAQSQNLTSLRKTVTTVANLNANHVGQQRYDPIEMLISFHPHGNLSTYLGTILDIVQEANSINNHTISTLLLNFGSLRLDPKSLSQVRQDIETSNKIFGQEHLLSGFIFDPRSCPADDKNLNSLKFQKGNVLIIKSTQMSEFCQQSNKLSYNLEQLERCFGSTTPDQLKYGIPFSTVVNVDYLHKNYSYEPSLYKHLFASSSFPVIGIHWQNDSNHFTKRTTCKEVSLPLEQHLRQPAHIDRRNVGIRLSVMDLPVLNNASLMSSVLQRFRKVVIEFQISEDSPSQLVQDIIENFKRDKSQRGPGYQISNISDDDDDDIPVEMLMIVNVDERDVDKSVDLIKDAVLAYKAANEIYAGAVTAVLVKLPSFCSHSNLCDEEENKSYQQAEGIRANRTKILTFARNLKNEPTNYWLHLNIDTKLGTDKVSYWPWQSAYNKPIITVFDHGQPVLYSYTLEINVIKELGVIEASNMVTGAWENDSSLSFVDGRNIIEQEDIFCLDIIGCLQQDQTEEANYVQFAQLLNNWAVNRNKTIILANALEYRSGSMHKDVVKNGTTSSHKMARESKCGWWLVDELVNSILISDIKSVDETPNKPDDVVHHSAVSNMLWAVLPILVFCAFLCLPTIYVLYQKPKYLRGKETTGKIFQGNMNQLINTNGRPDVAASLQMSTYDKKKYEVKRSQYTVDMTRCLGYGEFAIVYPGCIKLPFGTYAPVAVKMNRKRGDKDIGKDQLALLGLVSEIRILSQVEAHKHIVKLEGAFTKDLRKGMITVFLERCHLGPLRKYLHSCRPIGNEHVQVVVSDPSPQDGMDGQVTLLGEELLSDMVRWTTEIAAGMEFLVSKNLVHADLATRNILLTSDKCAKISDFGLARRLYNYKEYAEKQPESLPWRWMAPEILKCLRKLKFNEKSDVWAFGVTLWEIFTLGDVPFSGLSWDVSFPVMLDRGLRLSEPRYKIDYIYMLMKRCWDGAAKGRPTFTQLELLLRDEYLLFRGRNKIFQNAEV